MTKNKIITGITIIIAIILSIIFISSNVSGLSKDDLRNIINNPTSNQATLEERYNLLSEYYSQIQLWSMIGETDAEEAQLFKQAADATAKAMVSLGPGYQSNTKDLNDWISEVNNIVVKDTLNAQDLITIRDTTSTDRNEIQNRYDKLRQWYEDFLVGWEFAPGKDITNVQIFRQATQKLKEYGASGLTEGQKETMNRWIIEAEEIIVGQGGEIDDSAGAATGDYNDIKPQFRIPIGTTFEFDGWKNDTNYVTPTCMTINGLRVHIYCVDHGDQPSSRLRTKSIKDDSWYHGLTQEYCSRSDCEEGNDISSPRTDVGVDYFDRPIMKITRQYDITSIPDDKYQYAGYLLDHLVRQPENSGSASWLGQNALWMTDLNRGMSGITRATDDFQSSLSAITKSRVINDLTGDETERVELAAMDVQTANDRQEIIKILQEVVKHYEEKSRDAEDQEMKDFYWDLAHGVDGIDGVRNWVENVAVTEIFANVKANAYQYLMTVQNAGATNVMKKIADKAQKLAADLLIEGASDTLVGAGGLVSEAYAYQEFYEDLKANKGVLKVENKTGRAIANIDRSDNTYTVGPFKIAYNDKYVKSSADTHKRVNFAEIVSIYIYNEAGQLYKTFCIEHIDPETKQVVPAKQEFKITKTPLIWGIDDGYIFPKSNEPFYVIFNGDKSPSGVTIDPSRMSIEVEFNYIAYYVAELYRTGDTNQSRYQWNSNSITHHYEVNYGNDCCPHTYSISGTKYKFLRQDTKRTQEQLIVVYTDEIIEKTKINIPVFRDPPPTLIKIDDDIHYDEVTMEISGKVFWDQNEGKESEPDGQLDSSEPLLKNIEVSLYEYDEKTGQSVLATLAPAKTTKEGKTEIRTNPTVTNKDGIYVFHGVRPMNKYYVQFTYNGQIYQATEFTAQSEKKTSNTGEEEDIAKDNRVLGTISNAMEFQTRESMEASQIDTATPRQEYNLRFSTIESAPYNYATTNSLGYGVTGKTYTQKELMGYKLTNNGDGTYGYNVDSSVVQLLDEVTTDGQLREGIISKKINEYIYGVGGTLEAPTTGANGKYPDLKNDIYSAIISEYGGRDPEIKDKLQFIEDTKMTADTTRGDATATGAVVNLLARNDRFVIGTKECVFEKGQYLVIGIDGSTLDFVDTKTVKDSGGRTITYHNLYVEQTNINLGVNERPVTDVALRSDVKEVTLEINGKSHVYDYDTRKNSDESDEENDTWEIGVRLSDIAGGGMKYYDQNYSRELYRSDYLYKASNYNNPEVGKTYEDYGKSKSDELEVYVTYKLTIRNQSLSIKTSIDEIVDYFDEDYEYIPERSYYTLSRRGDHMPLDAEVDNSAYGDRSKTSISGYENLYIKGLKGHYLESGQTVYAYVTFRVEKDNVNNEDWIKLDEDEVTANPIGVGKENIVEINGYSTIYEDGVTVPNVGNVDLTPAGITDTDSDPGNLEPSAVPKDGTIDYLTFEDDTDKAPNIRIILYRDHDRDIQGLVWEDSRNENVTIEGTSTDAATRIADGLLQDNETKINGVTVQLVELMNDGTEFIWRTYERGSGTARSTPAILGVGKMGQSIVPDYAFGDGTDVSGQYAFRSFAPGNYVIRFIYGDTVRTVLVNSGLTASGDTNTSKAAQITEKLKTLYNSLYGEEIDGLNAKSYNGQDYKSTTYQEQITQEGALEIRDTHSFSVGNETLGALRRTIRNYDKTAANQNESGTYYYNIAKSDERADVSDAKDIYENRGALYDSSNPSAGANDMKQTNPNNKTRVDVIDYSDTNVVNHIAEVLAAYRERPTYTDTDDRDTTYSDEELKALIDELMRETQMTAETGVIDIELEYNTKNTLEQTAGNVTQYNLLNINLGLEERPKAQLEIEKEITNVKVTLSDDQVLFDTGETATNVLWQKHKWYDLRYNRSTNLLDSNYFGSIERIRMINSNKFGVVQLSMDEEIMHGATIEITYKISIKNVGETDYNDSRFYYTGVVTQDASINKIVTTTPNQVVDYVANNLQFYEEDNRTWGWKEIKADDLLKNNASYSNLVNNRLEKQIKDYNTIITTEAFATPLVPAIYKDKVDNRAQDTIDKTLILTQLISPENEADDLNYRNIVEIVRTSNIVGRKNEYSVVGNQDPRLLAQELDSDLSEDVKILPPFGSQPTYYILWISLAGVLAVGIGFIVFKVLRRNHNKI